MNDFQKFQRGMLVTPTGKYAVGLKGTTIKSGQKLIIEQVFDEEGHAYLNFPRICDAFPATQFENCAQPSAVPA